MIRPVGARFREGSSDAGAGLCLSLTSFGSAISLASLAARASKAVGSARALKPCVEVLMYAILLPTSSTSMVATPAANQTMRRMAIQSVRCWRP